MRGVRRMNLALIELLIALLFFSLSSVVILRLFAATYDASVQSQQRTRALATAQNWADTAYALDFTDDALLALGWREEGGALALEEDGLSLTMTLAFEDAPYGRMLRGALAVENEREQALLTLPLAKFVEGEDGV